MALYELSENKTTGELELWGGVSYLPLGAKRYEDDGRVFDFVTQLVADANRGVESAAYDKAITAAGDAAVEQAFRLTPAALAHGLVRDAIGVLVGDPIPVGGSPYRGLATTVRTLGKALETLGAWLVYEQVTRGIKKSAAAAQAAAQAVPPQRIEQAIAEAHAIIGDDEGHLGLTTDEVGE